MLSNRCETKFVNGDLQKLYEQVDFQIFNYKLLVYFFHFQTRLEYGGGRIPQIDTGDTVFIPLKCSFPRISSVKIRDVESRGSTAG